ncbi:MULTISPECIES: myo-inosose-2 dehydratase [Vibrio]|jgi:inosose dehydratase|uniref:MocC n=1 Tax=Vibrio coralliilyticus TaxID=190893 RepID=A0AAE5GKT1_9VIBR|nr:MULTISPECIES: myo-inosose-2 dehydratase [Vibrio]AIW19174.1 MocC [Vibrio coralliilyticus]AXN30818.1 myo-inosose-2 dehydratase [Vibrio coralliilyticus]EEX31428.1 inosose dehydratase [Vibrio coralliilyticus ATCC BAA-450]ERB65875.1 xylose isomerase [Vibrio coralliilyticus OCN008]KFI10411.1 MocC [Vibrio sp. B183]
MSKVQYGISPLTWTNDDMPELGGEIPLETCLSEMAQAGFTGTELGTKYPREPEVLIPLLEKHNLVLASGWYSGNLMTLTADEEIDAMQQHIRLLKAAGCKAMVYGEVSNSVHGDIDTPLSQRVILSMEEWKTYGEKLTKVAKYLLEEHDIKLSFHHHVGTICETEDDINLLMELTGPEVFLTLDTGHVTYGGGNPVTMIERWGHRIGHMHFKDLRLGVMKTARDADKSFLNAVLDGVFTVPGTGDVNYDDVFAALKARNYEGWLLVEAEQDPAKAHPLTFAKTAYENISGYAEKYGL